MWCALALIITACDLEQFNNGKGVMGVAARPTPRPRRKKLLPSSSDVDIVVDWMMPGFVKEVV